MILSIQWDFVKKDTAITTSGDYERFFWPMASGITTSLTPRLVSRQEVARASRFSLR